MLDYVETHGMKAKASSAQIRDGSDDGVRLKIHADIAPKLNFAAHQCAFPVLRSLEIENLDPEEHFEDLVLTLESDPAFVRKRVWPVARVDPRGLIHIRDRDLEVDGGFLLERNERMSGAFTFRLEKDGIPLARLRMPVDLLAYNEWGGAGFMPELLAAFCMPNDPAVDAILRAASDVLRKAGKPDRIDGYESTSRERVWEIASAIYSAIANLGLTYAVPPASFEHDGQKVRVPSVIFDRRVATCLDTAMLFAAAFEQAGLNPIVALPKGHALVGVWLQPESLSTIAIDDAETLRKRLDLKELLLIETTCVTSRPPLSFSGALETAGRTVGADDDTTFSAAVDIRRARAHQITPLGLKSPEIVPGNGGQVVTAELPLEQAPALPDFDDADAGEDRPRTPESRLERWQRKLLDLTLRNPLLNHRSTQTSLKIICPDPGRLEDRLATGAHLRIISVPQPTSQAQDEEIHRERTGELITEEYARDELDRGRVLVDLSPQDLSVRAVKIFRRAVTALQEGGSNTLYLAIGFLRWKREGNDDRRFRAPLILLPVTLQRKSVRSAITMVVHDDEPRFNTTLLEMLRRDFGVEMSGLDGDLSQDDRGIDVGAIWNHVRRAVKEVPGFEVVADVVLGHFSFAKYLMWKDLVDRTEALRDNGVVRHLMDTPSARYSSDVSFVERRRLDRDYKPSDLLTALPADSSQMAAIAAADKGKDFVIIGPPGTGKSQTISNLIGHLLGKGKTVLFVSEKTAALEVVYRRLDQIGLGRFCLELHSNKARKTDVLKQLEAARDAAEIEPEDWQRKAEELLSSRDRLNRLVDHLHRKRKNGLTAFHAMGVKIRDEEFASRLALSWPCADQHDEGSLRALREVVNNLAIQAKAVGDISQSPFHPIETAEWTPLWQARVVERCGTLSSDARAVEDLCASLCASLGVELPDQSMTRLESLGELACVLLDSFRKPTFYALEPDGPDRIDALEEAEQRLDEYGSAEGSLSCPYEPFAWRELDGEEISRRWAEADQKRWPMSTFAKRRIVKELCTHGARGIPDPSQDAPLLADLRREGEVIDRLDGLLSGLKGWSAHATPPATAASLREIGQRARSAVGKLAVDPQRLVELRGRVRNLLHDGNDLLTPDGSVGRTATDYLRALEKLRDSVTAFEEVAGAAVRERFADAAHAPGQIREIADLIDARHLELRDWCAWRKRRAEAIDSGLRPLVNAVEAGGVPPEEIPETFEAAYCAWWSTSLIEEDAVLRTFTTPEHEAAIDKFRQLDDEYQQLTARYIAAKSSGRLPDRDHAGGNPQWGVLQREIRKQRGHKPVRKLLQAAPDVLTGLTPCFMMSPLSVAQYLPADQALFDVVIFDEASQITVWDAVGSIARGKQVIVAGDPKQMPPSNFFARADDDPDGDIETEGDLESILEEMLAASIPSRTLSLHYRSRHESLITFSNDRYYDNALVTFPAPVVGDGAVRLKRMNADAFYARGGARTNQGEARAIVAEIVSRLTQPNPPDQAKSIGVVTFNSEQQTLIENLLDDARRENPEIEWAFAAEAAEPVFVKNLETVQGDERDVILFSVTYGPDRGGHVTMNFGPLNRQGGERRLNVALTRARHELIVFSTLHPDAIDLSRTRARAVADLRDFLRYAENGRRVLGVGPQGYREDFDSPFERAVARALGSRGWKVHPQVGVSAYRIDLGVVHPDAPGRYLAGIECDGAMYHSSAFARERDKIRQVVLENLGWHIVRIWSTDWWTNKAGALSKLDGALHEVFENAPVETSKQRVNGTPDDGITPGSGEGDELAARVDPATDGEANQPEVETHAPSDSSPGSDEEAQERPPEAKGGLAPYAAFEGPAGPDPRNASAAHVADGLCGIIRVEEPMLVKRAYDIYLRGCGIRRMGRNLKGQMNRALQHAIRRGFVVTEDEWSVGGLVRLIVRSPDSQWVIARRRGPRRFDEIPPSELQFVARQVRLGREDELEFGSDEHLRAVLNAFDLQRLTTRIGATLLDVLERRYSYVDEALTDSDGAVH
ncbi:DUF4011 domain-containing protein [Candidatus Palauibacter sp.]|uniref:DUF4011 domain-containing protein n=1 Tax=Candidatus Palauibacter sp. TaxID=3101350 RepID=UPI003B020359